jgi:hypothetical protein
MLGLLESMIIFIIFGAVDQDTKSIFSLMKKMVEDFHFEISIDYEMSINKISSTK